MKTVIWNYHDEIWNYLHLDEIGFNSILSFTFYLKLFCLRNISPRQHCLINLENSNFASQLYYSGLITAANTTTVFVIQHVRHFVSPLELKFKAVSLLQQGLLLSL